MILLKLFYVFSKIGLFNFGGGYAMLSFIQNEVVVKHPWMSEAEFTDIVAISQMTPGAIGINAATYVGYTSVINDPQMQELFAESPTMLSCAGVLGALLSTIAVVWLPFIVMIMVSKIILKSKDSIVTKSIFDTLRPAIVGLLLSAVMVLLTDIDINHCQIDMAGNFGISESNFGLISESPLQFFLSIAIFVTVVLGVKKYRWNPLYTLLVCGIIGGIAYGIL